jgi:hypothetical protein
VVSNAECERVGLDSSNSETNLSWIVPFIVPVCDWILFFFLSNTPRTLFAYECPLV